jgi:DNA-binding GntR family transcriptional regulator
MTAPRTSDGPQAADSDRAPLAIDEWPYIQIADRIEDRIRRGEFGEAGQLPGASELADWYVVSGAVIRHARKELLHRGLVVAVVGRGTFVRAGTASR